VLATAILLAPVGAVAGAAPASAAPAGQPVVSAGQPVVSAGQPPTGGQSGATSGVTAQTGSAAGPPSTTAPLADPVGKPCTGTSPQGLYGTTLSFVVSTITPQAVTADGPTALTVTGTMTNTGEWGLSELGYKYQRGDTLVGEAAIRAEAARPCQPIAVVNSGFVAVGGELAPGASTSFTATVPIQGEATGTLAVVDPGVYPVMINFNATVQLATGDLRARVGEVHLLLTVLSVPPVPTIPGGAATSGATGTTGTTTAAQAGVSGTGSAGTGSAGTTAAPTTTPGTGTNPSPGTGTNPSPASGTHPSPATGTNPSPATTTTTVPAPGAPGSSPTRPSPIPYSMVWTVVDRPHLGVGGVFLDDALVPVISPGGRLYELIRTLTSTTRVAGSATLAIDPELLDELDRMSRGYWVVATTGSSQAPLTPAARGTSTTRPATGTAHPGATGSAAAGSAVPGPEPTVGTRPVASTPASGATAGSGGGRTGGSSILATVAAGTGLPASSPAAGTAPPAGGQPAGTVAGTGRAAAIAFLDELRRLASTTPVLVLPYSDPDAVALVRAGMAQNLASSVYLGRAVASRVLGVASTTGPTSPLITTVAYPVNGLADAATLSELGSLGATGSILAPAGLTGLAGGTSVTRVGIPASQTAPATSVTALVPNSTLLADIDPFLTSGVPANSATAMNLMAGVVAGEYFAGAAQPLLVVPGRAWTPNRAGVDAVSSLLATMAREGVVTGEDLRTLTRHPQGSATVAYPAGAASQELPAALLHRVDEAGSAITSLRISLTAVSGPDGADPADVLDPLEESLTRTTAAALRNNRDPASRVLHTVDSSLRAIEAGVTVPTSGGSLTLASSSAPLRLTVVNSLPYDVRLRIVIGGGQRVGLTASDPGVQDVPAGRSVPVRVSAHVARSGTFVITAQLVAMDGRPWGDAVSLQVNSRAYGTLTLVLLVVAGSVLVVMVVIRIVQRTRGRRGRGSRRPTDPGSDGGGTGSTGTEGPDGPPGPDDRTGGDGGRTPLTATDVPERPASLPAGRNP
jgi:hypothetical protein